MYECGSIENVKQCIQISELKIAYRWCAVEILISGIKNWDSDYDNCWQQLHNIRTNDLRTLEKIWTHHCS